MTKDKTKNTVLIAERKKRNLKQAEFAGLLGISQCFLSQLESGTKQPSFEQATRLSIILNVERGKLFKKYQ